MGSCCVMRVAYKQCGSVCYKRRHTAVVLVYYSASQTHLGLRKTHQVDAVLRAEERSHVPPCQAGGRVVKS